MPAATEAPDLSLILKSMRRVVCRDLTGSGGDNRQQAMLVQSGSGLVSGEAA